MRTTFKNELIKKAGAIFVFALAAIGASSLFAQPYIAWIRRYNGPVNRTDIAVKMTLDAKGNVYIVGISQPEIVTIKYDKYGRLLWDRRYGGPGGGISSAKGVGVDSGGNVYVGGTTVGVGTGYDFTILKYDSAGNQLWVTRYNISNTEDWLFDFTTDAFGNSYIAGTSYIGGLRYYDGLAARFNSQGACTWSILRDTAPGSMDIIDKIEFGSDGSVYVIYSGALEKVSHWSIATNGTYRHMSIDSRQNIYIANYSGDFTIKNHDSSGTLVWTRFYNGTGNGNDGIRNLAIDNMTNIYVAGFSKGDGTGDDFATVKYDSAGNELWVQRYNGPSNGSDTANAVAVDRSGNVYVVGTSQQSGAETDIVTVAYDSSGSQKWVYRYNGPFSGSDFGVDVAVNSDGDVYATGHSIDYASSYDIVTIKFASHLKGDLDGDGVVTLSDIALQLNCVFLGEGDCSPSASELNCDDKLTPADLVLLLLMYYISLPSPC